MKILFVGCKPSPELQQALDHHGLSGAAKDPELVVLRVTDLSELTQLKTVRANQPTAWLATIVPDAWLKDGAAYSALLAASEKDDVWLESQWESGFWLGLQRAVQSRVSKHREKKLQAELEQIQNAHQDLVTSSSALVDKLEGDAQLATNLHRKFYPRFSPDVPGVEVLSKYLPASGSGGDYFDIFEFGDKRRFAILLADSQSHKAAASLLSILLKTRLEDLKGKFSDSATFVHHLNEAVIAEQPNSTGILKLTYAVFDRANLQLQWTSAGGISPRVYRGGRMETVPVTTGPALTQAGNPWTASTCALEPGDTLLIYSDGLEKVLSSLPQGLEKGLQSLAQAEDALDRRTLLAAQVDAFQATQALPDDLTFILLNVSERALFVAPAIPIRR